jgi:predicted unusual protein kinase regulating ubiquinone biosynthesis (AarF/ABC1/UbiB family)
MALGRLLLKHRNALVAGPGLGSDLDLEGYGESPGSVNQEDAAELTVELERLGPTFVKFGQLLSTRSDLLPPVYLDELSRLRDDVDALPMGEAEGVIEEELGVRISKAFGSFDATPIAAASLGQVHRATLRDGRPVAVKVQRPGIRRQVLEDMEVISELAAFVDEHSSGAASFGFTAMVDQFRESLFDELDYRREAANLHRLGEMLADFRRIVVPQPIGDYTTSRVLTMDYVEGRSISAVTPVGRTELDGAPLAEDLIRAYLDQILIHGFFHADPHPGNVLLTPDRRLALIDLGMVARLAPDVQEQLLRLLLALSSQDGSGVTDALERLGTRLEEYDQDELRIRISGLVLRHGGTTVGRLATGRLLGELAMVSSSCGLQPRPELTMLGKALLNLDAVARTLDPSLEVEKIIENHAAKVMKHRMLEAASPVHVMRSSLDAAAFAEALPGRMDKVLESLAEGKLTLNLEGLDEPALMRGAQKLANRLAAGVMIASFVVAASLFSRDGGRQTFWGYPFLTIFFLALAAVVGIWLVVALFRRDLPQRTKRD